MHNNVVSLLDTVSFLDTLGNCRAYIFKKIMMKNHTYFKKQISIQMTLVKDFICTFPSTGNHIGKCADSHFLFRQDFLYLFSYVHKRKDVESQSLFPLDAPDERKARIKTIVLHTRLIWSTT